MVYKCPKTRVKNRPAYFVSLTSLESCPPALAWSISGVSTTEVNFETLSSCPRLYSTWGRKHIEHMWQIIRSEYLFSVRRLQEKMSNSSHDTAHCMIKLSVYLRSYFLKVHVRSRQKWLQINKFPNDTRLMWAIHLIKILWEYSVMSQNTKIILQWQCTVSRKQCNTLKSFLHDFFLPDLFQLNCYFYK